MSVASRLLAGCVPEPNTGCWLWERANNEHGYGLLVVEGRLRRAHRASYEVHRGPIPEGAHVLHRCDTPPCINPDHLFLGTRSDNMRDMVRKGRAGVHRHPASFAGERNGRAKLTAKQVAAIRASRAPGISLARAYGVSPQTVSRVRVGRGWQGDEIAEAAVPWNRRGR